MVLALGIIIFVIGYCLSSYEDNSYNAERRAEQRHCELMRVLEEESRRHQAPAPISYIYVGDCYWNGIESVRDFYNNPL